MHEHWPWLLGCWVVVMILVPLVSTRGAMGPSAIRVVAASTLAYAIAFDLAFIAQELALVLPKAFVPGLHPILFHNNHDWTGDAPIAELLQGTGALATFALGLAALAFRPRSPTLRLLIAWFAYGALVQSLAQCVVAAILPGNDVGRAFLYLGLTAPVRWAIAMVSMAALIALLRIVAMRLAAAGIGIALAIASLLLGTLLVLPYRVPGSIDQVVFVPVAVAVIGGFWLVRWLGRSAVAAKAAASPRLLAGIAIGLLLLFQIVLRPGIPF